MSGLCISAEARQSSRIIFLNLFTVTKEIAPQQSPNLAKVEPNASFKCLFSLWRPDPHSPSGVKQALIQIEPRKPEQHCLCGSLNRTFEGEC